MKYKFLFLLTIWLSLSCQNQQSHNKGMEQHADNSDFQSKHEKPSGIDFEGKGELIHVPVIGEEPANIYAVMSDSASDDYLFVFHEWWGLNDHIRREADRLFDSLENVHVFAIDLYDGEVTDQAEEAGALMKKRDNNRLSSIVEFARRFAGPEAHVATIGWCFGGGWSLRAAHQLGNQAIGCVVYYGRMPIDEIVASEGIKTDVLGVFAKEDKHITVEYAEELERAIEQAGQEMQVYVFDADHAFANPSSPRYEEQAAQEASLLTMNYLKEKFDK